VPALPLAQLSLSPPIDAALLEEMARLYSLALCIPTPTLHDQSTMTPFRALVIARRVATNGPLEQFFYRVGDDIRYKEEHSPQKNAFGRIERIMEHRPACGVATGLIWVTVRTYTAVVGDDPARASFWSQRLMNRRSFFRLSSPDTLHMVPATHLLATIGMFHNCEFASADMRQLSPKKLTGDATGGSRQPSAEEYQERAHVCRVRFVAQCAAHGRKACRELQCVRAEERNGNSQCALLENPIFYYEPWFDRNVKQ